MNGVAINVHFDGERILLDEPFDLPRNVSLPLVVPPVPPGPAISPAGTGMDAERIAWGRFGLDCLERAYGDDEPEYGLEDLRP